MLPHLQLDADGKSKLADCKHSAEALDCLEKAGLLQFPLPDAHALAATTLQVAQNIGLPGAARFGVKF